MRLDHEVGADDPNPVDRGRSVIGVGAEPTVAKRVDVDAATPLGEVDVPPALVDVPEQLVPPDELVALDDRNDVPVAEAVRAQSGATTAIARGESK